MSDELKACPFCGYPSGKKLASYAHFATCAAKVSCCGKQIMTDPLSWNTRPIEDALAARVAKLEKVRKTDSAVIERLRRFLLDAASELPPDEWEPFDSWNDRCGYGKSGERNYVAAVDPSNSGDVADHAASVSAWGLAKTIRAMMAEIDAALDACEEENQP